MEQQRSGQPVHMMKNVNQYVATELEELILRIGVCFAVTRPSAGPRRAGFARRSTTG
jgi:hypothetical protein